MSQDTPAKPPREFWLMFDENADNPTVGVLSEEAFIKFDEVIPVIEKSYADRLEQELADVRKERDKEQRQANVLAIALSTYRNHQFCECGVEGCGDCAEDCSVRAYVDGELLAYQAWRSGEG